ncbi:unnamed protein product [Caenorhabditis auriculariae]|uniref:C2H2-type domain-containing protein n=1 Tax=Caenorhabditis auriculariae TaxID=2777116 RepID=A0A8S1GNL3_9PELO|nr:unnamed protein product [Caenorhabditis auriculariae]
MDLLESVNDYNVLMHMIASTKAGASAENVCPYCMVLHPNAMQCRQHVEIFHPKLPYRPFQDGIDGTFEQVVLQNTGSEVAVRSRENIINSVLQSPSLTRDCVCPYCFLISSRRDNTRSHIKRCHPDKDVRVFVVNSDATLDDVRKFNENKKGRGIGFDSGKPLVRRARGRRASMGTIATGISPQSSRISIFDRKSEDDVAGLTSIVNAIAPNIMMPKLEEDFHEDIASHHSESDSSRNSSIDKSVFGFEEQQLAETANGQGGAPFGCVQCSCSFELAEVLEKHVATVHRTLYRCNLCLAEFVKVYHLSQHVSCSHPNKTDLS